MTTAADLVLLPRNEKEIIGSYLSPHFRIMETTVECAFVASVRTLPSWEIMV